MKEYGNMIVVKGRINPEKMDFYKEVCLKDAKSMKDYQTFKDYKFKEEYRILEDEHLVCWMAHDCLLKRYSCRVAHWAY